jgi:hypothetical protein
LKEVHLNKYFKTGILNHELQKQVSLEPETLKPGTLEPGFLEPETFEPVIFGIR